MTIDVIGVVLDPSLPNQFFEIVIGSQSPLPNPCRAVIERPGQEQSYLALSGWQSNYNYLEAIVRGDAVPRQGLRFSQNLLKFFESGYNYKVSLFDLSGADLGFFVIGWNPLEGFPKQDSPASPPFEAYEMGEVEPLPIQDDGDGLSPQGLEELTTPTVVGPREVVRCIKCSGEIFSTLRACPYCGSTLGVGSRLAKS